MTAAVFIPAHPAFSGTAILPATRGPMMPHHSAVVGRSRRPTDSLGVCQIEIQNAVVGSRYRVEVASTGALVAEGEVTTSNFTLTVPYYAQGNPANTLRIKIRKASESPFYRPFETFVITNENGALAYIIQQLDE